MTAREKIIAALAAAGVGGTVIVALIAGLLQEDCPSQNIKDRFTVARSFDETGHTIEWGDTTFYVIVEGRVYARAPYPNHWHRWTLSEGSGSEVFDSYGDATGVFGHGAEWQTDSIGTSVYFDGEDDVILLPNGYNYADADSFSVQAYFYVNSFGDGDGRIISKATDIYGADHWYMLSLYHDGCIRGRLKIDGETIMVVSDPGWVSPGTWYRTTMSYNGQTLSLWLNGFLVDAINATGPVTVNTSIPTTIGNQPQGGKPFHGRISDVRIW